jgi:putative transposase
MLIQKAYKVRLYPTNQQEQRLLQTVGACRFVWNHFLEQRKKEYLENGKTISYYDTALALTNLKRQSEMEWLDAVQTHPLQQSLRDLDTAYRNFFCKQSRYPRFKAKSDARQSFRKPTRWRFDGNCIAVERGLSIRFRGTKLPENVTWKSITVSKDARGHWHASMLAEEEITPKVKTGKPVGIDLGLTHLAITSDGKKYDNEQPRKRETKTMKRVQQSLSRKQKGSKRRERAKIALAVLHQKISNRRMNHLHQTSHRLTSKNHALIVVEDLAVKNMMRNHCLAGSIADTGWGEFIRQLEYKQTWRGGALRKVDRFFPSSKTCSNCSHIVGSLPLSVRQWTCPQCSTEHDRDVNAAKMILKQGLRNSLRVEGRDGSRKLRSAVRVTRPTKRKVTRQLENIP